MLNNAKFETSVFTKDKLLNTDLKQIALVGKSNVGKSSFINSLTNRKNLAKTGNTPGKTRSINYYNINEEFYLVDLPGYGYSTMSKQEKLNVQKLVDKYLTNKNIIHIFFLVDIRHKPTSDDRMMYDYLSSMDIPFTIIANKADKLAKTKLKEYTDVITKVLFAKEDVIPFSSENKLNLELIEEKINKLIKESM